MSKRKWHYISDKLPLKDIEVLGYDQIDRAIYIVTYNGRNFWSSDRNDCYDITYWMELPEPPE
jgi:hypothetical protein